MGALLGITGAIGSGKTTFATYLASTEPNHALYETWHVVAEVATAFNQALQAELSFETTTHERELTNQALIWLPETISQQLHRDVVWNQLAITSKAVHAQPDLYEKLFAYLKVVRHNPRLLDQTITASNKEIYRPLLQWIGGYLVAKISKTIWYDELFRRIDLREKDTNLVIIIGVRYPSDAESVRANGGKIVEVLRPNTKNTSSDPTEARRSEIKSDILVVNNGSSTDLARLAENLYNDIQSATIKDKYETLPL